MNLADAVRIRHTVKAFEAGTPVPAEQIETLLTVLHQSPSSVNSQPWHFVVASTPEGRARIAQSTTNAYAYNESKVLNASHVIAMCIRESMDERHLQSILEREAADGRFRTPQMQAGQDKSRRSYVDMHKYELRDTSQWMEKQVYLALGGLLLGAAILGVDATPMEGFDSRALDASLGLREKGLTSVVLVALGHRSSEDFNADLPKSRLPREQIFTFI